MKTIDTSSSRGEATPWLAVVLLGIVFLIGVLALVSALLGWVQGAGAEDIVPGLFTAFLLGGSGGASLYYLLFSAKLEVRKRARIRQTFPDEPWRWNPVWAEGRVEYSDRGTKNFFWLFSFGWFLLLGGLTYHKLPELRAAGVIWPFVVLGVAGLIGLLTVSQAIKHTRRFLRFGRSIFTLDPFPARQGQRLAGSIHTRIVDWPSKKAALTVRCERVFLTEEWVGSGNERRRDERRELLWEAKEDVPVAQLVQGPFGLSVPVDLPLPADPPATDEENPVDTISWVLEVRDRRRGGDFAAHFSVPVF